MRITASAEVGGSYGPETVTISRQSADRFTMYAPSWRPMAFRTLEAARAKLERHPGFVRWQEAA